MKRIGRDWDELPLARCRLTCHSVATEEACARRRTGLRYCTVAAHLRLLARAAATTARAAGSSPDPRCARCRGSVPVGLISRAAVRGFRHAVASCLSFYSSTCASTRAARRRCGSTRPVTARPDQTPGGWLHLAQTVNACPDHVAPTARESIETRPPRDASGNRRRAPRCAFCGRVGRGYKCGLPHAATDL